MSYGCHNRAPLASTVVVQVGWSPVHAGFFDGQYTRTPRMREIPDPMTKGCQFTKTTLGQRDPGCVGCKHKANP